MSTRLSAVLLALAACGDGSQHEKPADHDGGSNEVDAASIDSDGNVPVSDARTPVLDGSPSANDAAITVHDGQIAVSDAQIAVSDAQTPAAKPQIAVVLSEETGCTWAKDGKLTCFGQAFRPNPPPAQLSPYFLPTPTGVRQVSLSGTRICAVATPSLWCWGSGTYPLGPGSTLRASETPQELPQRGDEVALGSGFTCLRSGASVSCWGSLTTSVAANVTQLRAGGAHACVLYTNGNVACWGDNSFGQLGDPTGNRSEATTVRALLDVRTLATGGGHTCALVGDAGTLSCWGDNAQGQLALKTLKTYETPQKVPEVTGLTQISAGGQHTCARTRDASILCWGEGFGSTPSRVSVGRAESVAAGYGRSCAILETGEVTCWSNGQNPETLALP